MANQNYTLGRGKLYFSRFKTDTQEPAGFKYIGNTPEISLTIDTSSLDHFSSDAGIREKDDSVPLEVNRTGAFTTDSIKPDNLAAFFFGDSAKVTIVGDDITAEPISDILLGASYQLGASDDNPVGNRNVSAVVVKKGATTLVAGDDYDIDLVNGLLSIYADPAATLADGDDLAVDYTFADGTREQVLSGSQPVEGAMRYVANNPKGHNYNYTFPWVKLTPNGDVALKGDDWQTIPFNLEVLKREGLAAIYIDGAVYVD